MTAVIIAALLCSAPGQAVPDSVRPEVREAWLAQFGAATLGGLVAGGVSAGLISVAVKPDSTDPFATLGALALGALAGLAGIPAGAAAGASAVGEDNRQDGRFWAAFAGGLAGLPVTVAITIGGLVLTEGNVPATLASLALGLTAPGIGATAGYNLSRSRANRAHAWLDRLEPPATSATMVLDEHGVARAGVDIRLVTVRF